MKKRLCPTCEKTLDLSLFSFTKPSVSGEVKYARVCKACKYERLKEYRHNRKLDPTWVPSIKIDGNEKVCTKCAVEKKISEFRERKDRSRRDGGIVHHAHCKECQATDRKSWTSKNYDPVHNMFWGAHQRAKIKGIPFEITKEYLRSIYPKDNICPILEYKMVPCKTTRDRTSPSLDKIDPSKGYVVGNVKIVSWQANTMKNNASLKELKLFCINTLKFLNEKIYENKVPLDSQTSYESSDTVETR